MELAANWCINQGNAGSFLEQCGATTWRQGLEPADCLFASRLAPLGSCHVGCKLVSIVSVVATWSAPIAAACSLRQSHQHDSFSCVSCIWMHAASACSDYVDCSTPISSLSNLYQWLDSKSLAEKGSSNHQSTNSNGSQIWRSYSEARL